MMNHMPAGPGQPPHHISPTLPVHPQSRRQQEYHAYHHGPPQSPIHPHAYGGYHPGFYQHPSQPQYPPPRWQHQPMYQPMTYVSHPPPPPPPPHHSASQFSPRSPMVVTSQPQPMTQQMPPVTRHTPGPSTPHAAPSPRPSQPQMPPPSNPSASPTPAQLVKRESDYTSPTQPQQIRRQSQVQSPLSLAPEHKSPFYPTLPWYSPEAGPDDFRARSLLRRRKKQNLLAGNEAVALPARDATEEETAIDTVEEIASESSTIAAPSEPETPATSHAPSESDFAQVVTPTTPVPVEPATTKSPVSQQHIRKDTRSAIAVPNIPIHHRAKPAPPPPSENHDIAALDTTAPDTITTEEVEKLPVKEDDEPAGAKTPLPKTILKSWADLVRNQATVTQSTDATNQTILASGSAIPKSTSLAEALKQYDVKHDSLHFLEPRGLVNTGNMCYMNSILQILVFCSPFYTFLDQVRQRTVHSLKSVTPLVDAMIMFMREFPILASAESAGMLRTKLKPDVLEKYGDPVTPEYVYDAIRKLPRFQTMRRGHQQDAEEFLGFLLEGLHDECVAVMMSQGEPVPSLDLSTPSSPVSTQSPTDGWLEVGPKQKAAVTRTAGQQDVPSPVTKIFGGHFRSELRVPGLKDSVTLEPYKPLQLDIGAPHVNNIIDALKGLTHAEALTGDFGGRLNTAKKQVFIDTLPPVLILHLKRFQYENNLTGTQKIWKKVGYPLELEIPKEVFTPAKRGGLAVKGGLPKYRLISVVYHHGKSAAGGHYTVDVLRQDGQEWVRMDDTIIRRVRPEDVAEGGAEEDPKILAKALEQHSADEDMAKQRNMFMGLDEAEREPEEEKPWSEVNGHPLNGKKLSSIANTNGTTTPVSGTGRRIATATRKEGIKDNKVAYILLYERLDG